MIQRTFDPAPLNRIANDPSVRPWLGCVELGCAEGQIDLTAAIADPRNYALVAEGGGFLLNLNAPGEYEVHSMFLPEARGRGTVAAMRAGMDFMFTQTDCEKLITKVPDENKAAAGLARVGGFRALFRREKCWNGGGVTYHALTIDEWAMGNAALEADGEWFHERLEAAKKTAGSELPTHAHDPAHERAVGAAVRMMRAGNVAKALGFYNRWASFAGYLPITPLQVFDVGDAVIELRDGDMEILLCR